MFTPNELTGRTRTHIKQVSIPRFAVHHLVYEPFLALRDAAAQDGFNLQPFSSFRDFDTQLRIWNQKYIGKKPLYDITGRPRDFSALDAVQIIEAILNWSALPGGSRHQWGTEIDVIDLTNAPAGYKPKLLPEEIAVGGVFHDLHLWLDNNIEKYGFFRPYREFIGGMYPEPWHLSYWPVSSVALSEITVEILEEALSSAEILGKTMVLSRLDEFFAGHVENICMPLTIPRPQNK